jgi:hypothetical protein
MTLVLEGIAGSLVLFGALCKYAKYKYDKYKLKKQYPKKFSQTVEKWGEMTFYAKRHEKIYVLSAQYGNYDVRPWILNSMDTDYLQFSVDDDTLQCEPTPPDTKLEVTWEIHYDLDD